MPTNAHTTNNHLTASMVESATNANIMGSSYPQSISSSLTRRHMASLETETDHDTVTVDLADGRDYPIYIGANFDDKKGRTFYVNQLIIYDIFGSRIIRSVFMGSQ